VEFDSHENNDNNAHVTTKRHDMSTDLWT